MNKQQYMAFQVCTICTRSYLAQARVLYRSFRKFHPNIRFSALIFDAQPGATHEPFETFLLPDIGLPPDEENRMPMLYNVTELATALKPWFFRHLLAREPTELLYFDPDIEIFSPVDHLAALATKHCLVITPHTTRPMSRDNVKPSETDILSAGAYNLGFLGLNPDCTSFLDWWSERLLREAVIDPANMRFTDQRWMDFAPGYFDTYILKDETCNVAYWNADSRPLSWNQNRYELANQPLCFFHFSGFKPEDPHLLSFHQQTNPRTRLSEHPTLARLCREYAEKLADADYARLSRLPYGRDTAPDGLKITMPMRVAYRAALRSHEETGEPIPPNAFIEPEKFRAWLNEPLYPRHSPEITRYFWAIHATRPDLIAVFPHLFGADKTAYYDWLRLEGRYKIPIPDELFPWPTPQPTPFHPNGKESSAVRRGVTLTGYLRAEAGTGEAGRLMAAAIDASGEKQTTQVWSAARSRQNHPWSDGECFLEHRYDTNLICINADQLPAFGHEVGPEFFQDRYNIGLWFWEVEVFPPVMHPAFSYVHEIWVTSDFVRDAIARVSPIPVFTIPLPLNIPATVSPGDRSALDLPDGFLFLFSFDFLSIVERKNPVGLIEAFKRAFAPNEGPLLLIKSINGDRNLADMERLHYARGDRSDIIIRDGYLNADEKDALFAVCDCYVSLHRSEGFGLTIAEAMVREKPTIATRYSGNLEFMTDANSFLCGYELREVGQGSRPYPAEARWAEPDLAEAAKLIRFVYEHPSEARHRGQKARSDLSAAHTSQVAGKFIKERLSQLRRAPPGPVPFGASPSERPELGRLRSLIESGVNVRRIVPSLLTWIFHGPRRAMKQCLRAYEQHRRGVDLSALDAFNEIETQARQARESLARRVSIQEDELHFLKERLKEAEERMGALEEQLGEDGKLPASRQPNLEVHQEQHSRRLA